MASKTDQMGATGTNNILPTNTSFSFFLFSHTHPNKFCNMCLSTARQSSHYDNNLKHNEGRDFVLCGGGGYSSFGSVSVCLPSIQKALSAIPVSWEMIVISAPGTQVVCIHTRKHTELITQNQIKSSKTLRKKI